MFRRSRKSEAPRAIRVVVAGTPRTAADDSKILSLALERAREVAVPAIRFVSEVDEVNGRLASSLGVRAFEFEALVSDGDR